VNWILGQNGHGKSNLLEAVWMVMTGRSFRTNQLHDMVAEGSEGFVIEAQYLCGQTHYRVSIRHSPSGTQIERNGMSLPSRVGLFGGLIGTVWTSDDVWLIKGQPALRRRYLGQQMAQADASYTELAVQYQRALKQRNCLLAASDTQSLEVWDATFARLAADMTRRHRAWIEALNITLTDWFPRLFPKDRLELAYSAHECWGYEDTYHAHWKAVRARELASGHTVLGPHRDDLLLYLNGQEVKRTASEGQQRGCAAALRLAEWHRLRDATQQSPLFLIDDLALGFDRQRQGWLCDLLEGLNTQLLITVPHQPAERMGRQHYIQEGRVQPRSESGSAYPESAPTSSLQSAPSRHSPVWAPTDRRDESSPRLASQYHDPERTECDPPEPCVQSSGSYPWPLHFDRSPTDSAT
jgi:DNA replication and repair protein RecF